MSEINDITPETLPRLRGSFGLTQAELGAILGLEKHNVSKIESGKRAISPAEMKILRLYFFAEIPFDVIHQQNNLSSVLEFRTEEWRIIEILALRDGITPAKWIKAQILAYLDHNPRAQEARREAFPGLKVADAGAAYGTKDETQGKSSRSGSA